MARTNQTQMLPLACLHRSPGWSAVSAKDLRAWSNVSHARHLLIHDEAWKHCQGTGIDSAPKKHRKGAHTVQEFFRGSFPQAIWGREKARRNHLEGVGLRSPEGIRLRTATDGSSTPAHNIQELVGCYLSMSHGYIGSQG